MDGAPRSSDSGFYHAVFTDTASLYTSGSLTANGSTDWPTPADDRQYMIGADSDIGAVPRASVYASVSRAEGLDHFHFARPGDETYRLAVAQDGSLLWADGYGPPFARIVPTGDGIAFELDAPPVLPANPTCEQVADALRTLGLVQ